MVNTKVFEIVYLNDLSQHICSAVCIFVLTKAMSKYTCSEEWVQVAAVYLGEIHKLCQ